MNKEALTEEGQALLRLLGGEGAALDSTRLAAFGSWLVSTLKALAEDTQAECDQMWARPQQIAERFGARRSQVSVWLCRLVNQGKVRRWQPETAKGTKGDTFYYLPDIEKAWSINPLTEHESK